MLYFRCAAPHEFFATTADKLNDVDRVIDPISLEKIALVFQSPWVDECHEVVECEVSLGDYLALNLDPVKKEDGSLLYEDGELYRIEGAAFALKEKANRHNKKAGSNTQFHVTRYYKVCNRTKQRVDPETGLNKEDGSEAEEHIYDDANQDADK